MEMFWLRRSSAQSSVNIVLTIARFSILESVMALIDSRLRMVL